MARKRKPSNPFGVGSCSLCEQITLTFGQQQHGGIRYYGPTLTKS
jgi:hypothetical protein